MINFRFHLASLVAIFLALALGVVIGAGVIDRGVVDALDNRLNRVEDRSDRLEGENSGLRSELGEQDDVFGALTPHALDGRLTNADVGVVAVRGVDSERVSRTVEMLQLGGATVTGVLWLERPWNLDDDEQVAALGDAIGSTARRPSVLRAQAWEEIARRFTDPAVPGSPAAEDPATDVLVALRDAGFVGFDSVDDEGGETDLAEFPGFLASIVLVVGTTGDVAASTVVMPAATAITGADLPLVVGDVFAADEPDAGSRGDDLAELRASDLSESVSTVDDLDRPQGPVTVVLAVADLLLFPPVVGHYGLGPDTVVLPARVVP
jgi:hypothetical protein